MNPTIHPTAIVHPDAKIGANSTVAAYAIIDKEVVLGEGCEIQEHAIVRSFTKMGDGCRVFPGAVVGGEPQHLKYQGEPTTLEIGNRVVLRECVTVHRGTLFGNGVTKILDDTYIMAYCHVAHDCIIGTGVIIANDVQLAGHVEIGDFVTIGGQSAIPQFTRVGRYSFIGGGSILRKDVPPYLVGKGNPLEVQGINVVGLSRRDFSAATISKVKSLYKIFYMQKLTVEEASRKALETLGENDEILSFINFIKESKVGIVR